MLQQPRHGFRATSDSVFIGAAITAVSGDTLLDVGVGAGAALLCAAIRLPDCRFVGLDVDAEAVACARVNALANGWDERIDIVCADIAAAPAVRPQQHVFTNPPYHALHSRPSPSAPRALARRESSVTFERWMSCCADLAAESLTAIFPAVREADFTKVLGGAWRIDLLPLVSRSGQVSKRVIARARRSERGGVHYAAPFVVHDESGRFTPEAESVLRGGDPLVLAAGAVRP